MLFQLVSNAAVFIRQKPLAVRFKNSTGVLKIQPCFQTLNKNTSRTASVIGDGLTGLLTVHGAELNPPQLPWLCFPVELIQF